MSTRRRPPTLVLIRKAGTKPFHRLLPISSCWRRAAVMVVLRSTRWDQAHSSHARSSTTSAGPWSPDRAGDLAVRCRWIGSVPLVADFHETRRQTGIEDDEQLARDIGLVRPIGVQVQRRPRVVATAGGVRNPLAAPRGMPGRADRSRVPPAGWNLEGRRTGAAASPPSHEHHDGCGATQAPISRRTAARQGHCRADSSVRLIVPSVSSAAFRACERATLRFTPPNPPFSRSPRDRFA